MSKKSGAGAETKEQGGEVGEERRGGRGSEQPRKPRLLRMCLEGLGAKTPPQGWFGTEPTAAPSEASHRQKHHPWETQLRLPCLPPPGREGLISKSPITARGSFASSPSQGQSTRLKLSLSLLRLVEVFSHALPSPEVSKQTRARFSLLSSRPTRTCGAPRNSPS